MSKRIDVDGDDEVAQLARTFNGMLDRLEVAFSSQREFIRDISHELRTPIAVSRGHLELLAEGHLTGAEERRATISLVTGELDRMNRFVFDLLLLAKAESPNFLHLETVVLDEFVGELVAKAEATADRDWRNGGDSSLSIVADRQRLTQAVMNLVGNAVEHTKDGDEIEIGAKVAGSEVTIWVRDSGVGIAPSEQRQIFTRFTRGGGSSRLYEGTGIGLAIVRAIAEAHGGRVRVSSRPGEGARFDLVLPVEQEMPDEEDDHVDRGGLAVTRILIVEDEPRFASFLEKGLTANGYTTKVVVDGVSAGAVADDEEFDLMILDLGLPDMDGVDVLRMVRQRGVSMPVIILTARDDMSDKVSGLDAGASDYMTKPFSLDELLARVRARLRDEDRVEPTVLEAGPLALDLRTRRATVDGEIVTLTAREFTMLETLMRHRDQVLSKEQLLSHVWGYDFDPGSNVVEVYVGYLRRKLGGDLIETVRGMGYRLRV